MLDVSRHKIDALLRPLKVAFYSIDYAFHVSDSDDTELNLYSPDESQKGDTETNKYRLYKKSSTQANPSELFFVIYADDCVVYV